MTWGYIWDPDLEGMDPDELRKLIYGFHPSPNGQKREDAKGDNDSKGEPVFPNRKKDHQY